MESYCRGLSKLDFTVQLGYMKDASNNLVFGIQYKILSDQPPAIPRTEKRIWSIERNILNTIEYQHLLTSADSTIRLTFDCGAPDVMLLKNKNHS